MTISIKDVAARAGVSPKTVSRVINGEAHVKAAKRDAVMRVVAELGYRPNAFARSLSSSRSYLLGLFSNDPRSSYAADVHLGALHRCREKSYHLIVEQIDRSELDWTEKLTASLATLKLDGVILTPPLCDDGILLDLLESFDVPFVRLAPGDDHERSAYIMIDDRAAAAEMTRYLIRSGHSRIGFVKGDPAHSASARRYSGFRSEMEAHGLEVDPEIVVEGDFSARSGLECGERILSAAQRSSAIFASNDDMALGVLMSAAKLRIDVPSQLAIAGFDDAPLSRAAWPQLTTIRQPNAEMAAAAVDVLTGRSVDRSQRSQEPVRIMLDYDLIVRGSTDSSL